MSTMNVMSDKKFTNNKPVEPGWFWYKDADYGPAPVYVEWTGFVQNENARQLEVTLACGDDSDQPRIDVASLQGMWAGPITEPIDS